MTTPGGPSPGWYPDPSGEHGLRYWDGSDWTERVRDAVQGTDRPAGAQAPEAPSPPRAGPSSPAAPSAPRRLLGARVGAKAAAAIVLVAAIAGAGVGALASGNGSEPSTEPAQSRGTSPSETTAAADTEPAPPPASSDCVNGLVEGEGEEFTTALGELRICGASLQQNLPELNATAPAGLLLLVIQFEPVEDRDPNEFSELFFPDAPGGQPTVTLPGGQPATLEAGGLVQGTLEVVYTVPADGGTTFVFEFPGADPITLRLES